MSLSAEHLPTEHEIRVAIREERARLEKLTGAGCATGAHASRNKLQPLMNQLELVQRRARKSTIVVEENDLFVTVVDR